VGFLPDTRDSAGQILHDRQRSTGSTFVLNAIIETQAIKLLLSKPVAVLQRVRTDLSATGIATPCWQRAQSHSARIRFTSVAIGSNTEAR
jgi:hypothetical protein